MPHNSPKQICKLTIHPQKGYNLRASRSQYVLDRNIHNKHEYCLPLPYEIIHITMCKEFPLTLNVHALHPNSQLYLVMSSSRTKYAHLQ